MRPTGALRPEFVQFIPDQPDEGVLYISRRYRTASHSCCCGCGLEVVTPLNPEKWHLTEHPDGSISLMPSVGNWSLPCKSHYFIARNRIEWARAMSPGEIAAVQARDKVDVDALAASSRPTDWAGVIRAAWAALSNTVKTWLRGE